MSICRSRARERITRRLVSTQLWERLRSNFRAQEGKDSTIVARFRNKERSSSDSRFGRGRAEIVEER